MSRSKRSRRCASLALLSGQTGLAILGGASLMMDITFVILGGILIYLSWSTYREQR